MVKFQLRITQWYQLSSFFGDINPEECLDDCQNMFSHRKDIDLCRTIPTFYPRQIFGGALSSSCATGVKNIAMLHSFYYSRTASSLTFPPVYCLFLLSTSSTVSQFIMARASSIIEIVLLLDDLDEAVVELVFWILKYSFRRSCCSVEQCCSAEQYMHLDSEFGCLLMRGMMLGFLLVLYVLCFVFVTIYSS